MRGAAPQRLADDRLVDAVDDLVAMRDLSHVDDVGEDARDGALPPGSSAWCRDAVVGERAGDGPLRAAADVVGEDPLDDRGLIRDHDEQLVLEAVGVRSDAEMPAGAGPGLDRLADPTLGLRLLQLREHLLHVGERPVVLVGEVQPPQPGAAVALELVQHHPRLEQVVDRGRVDREPAAEAVEVAHDQHVELARLGEHPGEPRPGRVVALKPAVVVDGVQRPVRALGDGSFDPFPVVAEVPAVLALILGADPDVASRSDRLAHCSLSSSIVI